MLPLSVFLIVSGFAVGSFLALLADRLPRGEDVVRVPSACRHCGTPIGWRDKVPVLSYLWLRGRCRRCKAAIPKQLFYTEIAGGALAIVAVLTTYGAVHMMLSTVFLWCLLGLVLCDLAAFRLPDTLTALLFLTGLGLAWEDPGRDIQGALIAAAAGAGAFWLIRLAYQALRRREGLGLGDVKLMGGIGAALGLTALPVVALVAALGALALTLLQAWRRGQTPAADQALPFGAYLAGAAGLVWLTL